MKSFRGLWQGIQKTKEMTQLFEIYQMDPDKTMLFILNINRLFTLMKISQANNLMSIIFHRF